MTEKALPTMGLSSVRLVTYNIHYGFGRDGTNNLERIADAIDGADVVALQEVERFWPRSGMVDQVAHLTKLLPDYWVAFGANIDLHSPLGFPGEANTARRQFGNMILSRYRISSWRNILLPRPAGEPQTMQRGAVEAIIDSPCHGPLRVYSAHLDYLSRRTRRAQLETLAATHRSAVTEIGAWVGTHAIDHGWVVGDEPSPTTQAVILGDLNFVPDGSEYRAALRSLDGFFDVWPRVGDGSSGATKDGSRIDYALVTAGLIPHLRGAWVSQDAVGSDHQPVSIELE